MKTKKTDLKKFLVDHAVKTTCESLDATLLSGTGQRRRKPKPVDLADSLAEFAKSMGHVLQPYQLKMFRKILNERVTVSEAVQPKRFTAKSVFEKTETQTITAFEMTPSVEKDKDRDGFMVKLKGGIEDTVWTAKPYIVLPNGISVVSVWATLRGRPSVAVEFRIVPPFGAF